MKWWTKESVNEHKQNLKEPMLEYGNTGTDHSYPFHCPFRSVPVHSTVHSGPFRCPFGSVRVHSCPFRSIPVRSGLFRYFHAPLKMTAVVRIKRRRNEDPQELLLLSCKKLKSDTEKDTDLSQKTLFKFAGTVNSKVNLFCHVFS